MNFRCIAKNFTAHRNFANFGQPEHIFSDLVELEAADYLSHHEALTSGIDHRAPKSSRPFQYGEKNVSLYVFDQLHWAKTEGRFGNGINYGVWYGALEEDTSVAEAVFHRLQEAMEFFKNPLVILNPIPFRRAMVRAASNLESLVDLTQISTLHDKLISEDYSFCRSLGQEAVDKKIDGFFTPSARKPNGICTPIFNRQVISDTFIYYFEIDVYRDGKVEISRQEFQEFLVPKEWKTSLSIKT